MHKLLPTLLIFLFITSLHAQKNLHKTDQYKVVINHEEQYSIWPSEKPLTKEWTLTEKKGTYTDCMNYIEEVWTDMRPLSIRKMNLSEETPYMVIEKKDHLLAVWPEKMKLPEGWKKSGPCVQLEHCNKLIVQKGYGFDKTLIPENRRSKH